MKYVIDLDPTHLVLRVTVTGTVTDPATRELYASVGDVAAAGGPYAAIFDLSEVTGNQLSIETVLLSIETVLDLVRKRPAVPGGRPRVVVAPRPEDYGLFRMFEVLRDEMGRKLHLVISMDEAYAMLGVSPEDFYQRLFPEQLAA